MNLSMEYLARFLAGDPERAASTRVYFPDDKARALSGRLPLAAALRCALCSGCGRPAIRGGGRRGGVCRCTTQHAPLPTSLCAVAAALPCCRCRRPHPKTTGAGGRAQRPDDGSRGGARRDGRQIRARQSPQVRVPDETGRSGGPRPLHAALGGARVLGWALHSTPPLSLSLWLTLLARLSLPSRPSAPAPLKQPSLLDRRRCGRRLG